MSKFVSAVDAFGITRPNTVAFANSRGESITYGELKRASDALAAYLRVKGEDPVFAVSAETAAALSAPLAR